MSKKKAANPKPKEHAKPAAKTPPAAGPYAYLAIYASIAAGHAQAPLARRDLVQRLGLEVHQWVTTDAAVVQVRKRSEQLALLADLAAINAAHDPYFSFVAFDVPHSQEWWLSDVPTNLPSISTITGRKPS